jgi:hypothetical protein
MLSVVNLPFIMIVIMLNVVILSVVAPQLSRHHIQNKLCLFCCWGNKGSFPLARCDLMSPKTKKKVSSSMSDQKIRPISGNVAKTVAKIQIESPKELHLAAFEC